MLDQTYKATHEKYDAAAKQLGACLRSFDNERSQLEIQKVELTQSHLKCACDALQLPVPAPLSFSELPEGCDDDNDEESCTDDEPGSPAMAPPAGGEAGRACSASADGNTREPAATSTEEPRRKVIPSIDVYNGTSRFCAFRAVRCLAVMACSRHCHCCCGGTGCSAFSLSLHQITVVSRS